MPDPAACSATGSPVPGPSNGGLRPVPSSFRDPAGCVVFDGRSHLRIVRPAGRAGYDRLMASGLYEQLVGEGLLVPHEELAVPAAPDVYKLLRPRQVPFISYPYEWCFGQWRDAALVTLRIQELALARGLSLKDASAFNIQFVAGRPVLIDTLSFEVLERPRPWVAYGQFCRHFLAPLALMAYCDVRLGRLLQTCLDGVPLDLASRLLPRRTRWRLWLRVHLHWHAASERRFRDATRAEAGRKSYSENALRGLVASLQKAVQGLPAPSAGQDWSAYYGGTVTGGDYVAQKQRVVEKWLREMGPRSLWDLGANTGLFSRLSAGLGIETVSFDSDPACVQANYEAARREGSGRLLPLLLDLTNPSPGLGWANSERMTPAGRGRPDAVLALALVHHLAIGNNVPLEHIARFLAGLGDSLIVEFVPKDDPNAQKLLRVREDIFHGYTREAFERAFAASFTILAREPMTNSDRVLYRMGRRAVGS